MYWPRREWTLSSTRDISCWSAARCCSRYCEHGDVSAMAVSVVRWAMSGAGGPAGQQQAQACHHGGDPAGEYDMRGDQPHRGDPEPGGLEFDRLVHARGDACAPGGDGERVLGAVPGGDEAASLGGVVMDDGAAHACHVPEVVAWMGGPCQPRSAPSPRPPNGFQTDCNPLIGNGFIR